MKKESYNSGTVYMLFDNPGDKDGMSFLLKHETASIKQIVEMPLFAGMILWVSCVGGCVNCSSRSEKL